MIKRANGASAALRGILLSGIVSWGMFGCSGTDATGLPPILSTNPYSVLRLNVRAAVMSTVAPYDTLQFVATAYDASGAPILHPGPVKFKVSDTTLSVSTTGLLTVKHPTGSNSFVVASVQDTALNVTHVDTAYILATATVPAAPIHSFSIQFAPGDSGIRDVDQGAIPLPIVATDANGAAIDLPSLRYVFVSSNALVASVDTRSGIVQPVMPGRVTLTAVTTFYGVTLTDSVQLTIGYPDFNEVTVNTTIEQEKFVENFVEPVIKIAQGKSILFDLPYQNWYVLSGISFSVPWYQFDDSALSVVFDDSTNVATAPPGLIDQMWNTIGMGATNGSGNIEIRLPSDSTTVPAQDSLQYDLPYLDRMCIQQTSACAAIRSFPKAGTYHYHSALTGSTGAIIVLGQ